MLDSVLAFVAVSAIVICTPGQDTALTIRNTLAGGRRSGVATAGGVALGQAVWTVAASAGIVALLSASEPVFRALKLAGAAFCAMRFAWLTVYAVAVARLGRLLTGSVRRALDAVTGVVLVALGLRLATEDR